MSRARFASVLVAWPHRGDPRGRANSNASGRHRGEIAAEVAHELRNVLQIISASAFVGRQDPPASLPHLEKIERNARLAFSIVDDLMSLARGEPAQTSPVLVAEVLGAAARAEMEPGEAAWEDAITPSDLRVRAHPGLVARVLHALLRQRQERLRATPPPSIVTKACRAGDRVVVEVTDDGPGVPEHIAPRIFFDPPGDGSRRRNGPGARAGQEDRRDPLEGRSAPLAPGTAGRPRSHVSDRTAGGITVLRGGALAPTVLHRALSARTSAARGGQQQYSATAASNFGTSRGFFSTRRTPRPSSRCTPTRRRPVCPRAACSSSRRP